MGRKKTDVKRPQPPAKTEALEPPRLELPAAYVVDPTGKGLGQRIQESRTFHGFTLDALSLMTKAVDPERRGISRNALSRYELGTADPGARELRLLSQALRRPLSFLIYGDHDDPMEPPHGQPIELVIEDYIAEQVNAMLLQHGLVKKSDEQTLETWRELYLEVRQAVGGKKKD